MDRDDPRYISGRGRIARVMSRKLKQTEYTMADLDRLTPDISLQTVKIQLGDLIIRGRISWRDEGGHYHRRRYYKIHPPHVLILDPKREIDFWKAQGIHHDINDALGILRFSARKLLEGGVVDPETLKLTRERLIGQIQALETRLAIMKALAKNPDLWDVDTLPDRLYPYLASDNEKTEQS